ncbi:uncharacterized protein LOC141729010 [Zonotrichia albicollis]|uniref:uncharacterized protein LOC141729010 n=1 Tax=Zonotrichia albicollis TaxID=44394 RepID=UPI003D80EF21
MLEAGEVVRAAQEGCPRGGTAAAAGPGDAPSAAAAAAGGGGCGSSGLSCFAPSFLLLFKRRAGRCCHRAPCTSPGGIHRPRVPPVGARRERERRGGRARREGAAAAPPRGDPPAGGSGCPLPPGGAGAGPPGGPAGRGREGGRERGRAGGFPLPSLGGNRVGSRRCSAEGERRRWVRCPRRPRRPRHGSLGVGSPAPAHCPHSSSPRPRKVPEARGGRRRRELPPAPGGFLKRGFGAVAAPKVPPAVRPSVCGRHKQGFPNQGLSHIHLRREGLWCSLGFFTHLGLREMEKTCWVSGREAGKPEADKACCKLPAHLCPSLPGLLHGVYIAKQTLQHPRGPMLLPRNTGYLCNAQDEPATSNDPPLMELGTSSPTTDPLGKYHDPEISQPGRDEISLPTPEGRSLPTLVVAGVSIALVLLCILIVAIFWYAWKKSQEGSIELNPIPYGEAGVSLRSVSMPENQQEWPFERAGQ